MTKAELDECGIKRILNVAKELPFHHPKDYKYKKFALDDDEEVPIGLFFKEAVNFIRILMVIF